MKINYSLLTVVFLVASVPLAWMFLQRRSAQAPTPVVRFASFNVAMNRDTAGELLTELETGECVQARRIAEIVQRNAPDVVLLCEVDRDAAGRAADVFAERYLAVAQNGQQPLEYPFRFCGEVNTGVPSGLDVDRDGSSDGPADAFGYGKHPGQYGMVLLSRHPILKDRIRTFRKLPWSSMPNAMQPSGFWDEKTWAALRLSSKSHWDVPIGIGAVDKAQVVHVLCSHPTPPGFDGDEDRNGCRNHDEIRFWDDYLTPAKAGWVVDDAGKVGGLDRDASFVILGDLNCDPVDGEPLTNSIVALLANSRLQDPQPASPGGDVAAKKQWGVNAEHKGDPRLDTGDFGDKPGSSTKAGGPGNLRVDYVLPSRDLRVFGSGVFWPLLHEPGADLVDASDHRLVWVDIAMK